MQGKGYCTILIPYLLLRRFENMLRFSTNTYSTVRTKSHVIYKKNLPNRPFVISKRCVIEINLPLNKVKPRELNLLQADCKYAQKESFGLNVSTLFIIKQFYIFSELVALISLHEFLELALFTWKCYQHLYVCMLVLTTDCNIVK